MGVVLETEVVEEMGVVLDKGSAAGGRRAAGGIGFQIALLRSLSCSGGRGVHGRCIGEGRR